MIISASSLIRDDCSSPSDQLWCRTCWHKDQRPTEWRLLQCKLNSLQSETAAISATSKGLDTFWYQWRADALVWSHWMVVFPFWRKAFLKYADDALMKYRSHGNSFWAKKNHLGISRHQKTNPENISCKYFWLRDYQMIPTFTKTQLVNNNIGRDKGILKTLHGSRAD